MKYKKIDLSGLDMEIDIEAAKSYIEFRIECKKPLTQRAFNQAMQTALQAYRVNMTPTELIDWTVAKGWHGININYTIAQLQKEQDAISSTRGTTIQEQLTDRTWAH